MLYGGTAVGLQLGHRKSVDFDFFSDRRPSRADLLAALPILAEAEVLQDERGTFTVLAHVRKSRSRPVKVSFVSGLTTGRVGTPHLSAQGEILIASLADLLGHKLKVVLQRAEAKDYQYIAAMLRAGQKLEEGVGAALSLFGKAFPVSEALRALVYFSDVDSLGGHDRRTLIEAASSFSAPAAMPRLSDRLAVADVPARGSPT